MDTKCEKCGGEGEVSYEEDGRMVTDVCYRCGGSGKVDEETAHHTRLEGVCGILADVYVEARRKAYNEDPEGEGWDFRAAENMMTPHDYTMGMKYDFAAIFGEMVGKLDERLQNALILALNPPKEEKVVVQPTPVTPVVVVEASNDDIPF